MSTKFLPLHLLILALVIFSVGQTLRFYALGQTCFTPDQINSDSRCLYILNGSVYEKGSRDAPHQGHPCGLDVSSIIPSTHMADVAFYLDPARRGQICAAPSPTSEPTPEPTPVPDAPTPTTEPTAVPSNPEPTTTNPQPSAVIPSPTRRVIRITATPAPIAQLLPSPTTYIPLPTAAPPPPRTHPLIPLTSFLSWTGAILLLTSLVLWIYQSFGKRRPPATAGPVPISGIFSLQKIADATPTTSWVILTDSRRTIYGYCATSKLVQGPVRITGIVSEINNVPYISISEISLLRP